MIVKKLFKMLLWFSLVMLLLVMLLALFTQTQLFRNIVRDKIVTAANNSLNCAVSIDRIDGNLISRIEIHNLLLGCERDTLFYLPQFFLEFKPRQLLRKKAVLQVVELQQPYLKLVQYPDSSWNFSDVVKQNSDQQPDTTTKSAPFAWTISLTDMQLISGRIQFSPLTPSTMIPRRIDQLNTQLSLEFDQQRLAVDLRDFNLSARQPDFQLTELSFLMTLRQQKLLLENLRISSPKSIIQGDADVGLNSENDYTLRLTDSHIELQDVKQFVPEIPISGVVNFNLNASYVGTIIEAAVNLSHNGQQLSLSGRISEFPERPRYDLKTILQNVDVGYWLNNNTLTGSINGVVLADGMNFKPEQLVTSVDGRFKNCLIGQNRIDSLLVLAKIDSGRLRSEIHSKSNIGRISATAVVKDLFNIPAYKLSARLRDVDLSPVLNDARYKSSLNCQISATGRGVQPEKLSSSIELNMFRSELPYTVVDSFYTNLTVDNQTFFVDTLFLRHPAGLFASSGTVSLNTESDLDFSLTMDHLNELDSFINTKGIRGVVRLNGAVKGAPDSLYINSQVALTNMEFNAIEVKTISGDVNLQSLNNKISANARLSIFDALVSDIAIDSLRLVSQFQDSTIAADVSIFQSPQIYGQFKTGIDVGKTTRISLPQFTFNVMKQNWRLTQDSSQIILHPDSIDIRNFRLASEDQMISVAGIFSARAAENLKIEIENLNLVAISQMLELPFDFSGMLNFNSHISGTAHAPIVRGQINIEPGSLNNFNFNSLNVQADYAEQMLNWNIALTPIGQNRLASTGSYPLKISLADKHPLTDSTRALFANITADDIDFSLIQAISDEFRDVSGVLSCDLNITNTLDDPIPSGQIFLKDGKLRIPKSGIRYHSMQLAVGIDSNRIAIDNFLTRSGDGILSISGSLGIDRRNLSQFIQSVNLNIAADKFVVMNHRDFETEIEGDIIVDGDFEQPEFDGLIRVLRSRFYLPAVTGSGRNPVDQIQPLLVQATKRDSIVRVIKPRAGKTDTTETFIDKLQGSARIEIPRNTWIRSPDMNVELSGELVLVKSGKNFELFGSISVRRGHYDLYGKRFKIQKGEFTFEGGRDYNPKLDLKAEHVFRTVEKEKKTLKLNVTGKATSPTLEFSLDDVDITEGDALSYLLFGKSLEGLTHGQKSDLDNQSGGLNAGATANNLIVGFIAGQLSRTIGNKLNLDVIELKGEDNWQYATFIIGKYLTNDLFLSYKREFGLSQTNETVPDEITLEYEINRHLFLQLIQGPEKTAGVDVIFKIER